MHVNILNKDITSHIEIRMLPSPHPSWPPSHILPVGNMQTIYVFYASDSVYIAGMTLYGMSPAAHMSVIIVLLGNPLYKILQVVSFRTSVILS